LNAGPATFGTVLSVGSKTFTLKSFSGKTVTVDVSSSTTYRDFQVASPSFTTLKANERVAVFGTSSSGVLTAKSVVIGAPRGNFGHGFGGGWHEPSATAPPVTFGTVLSVGSKTFTLKTFSGKTVTVDVSSSTTYRDFQVASPSFTTLKANEPVAVFGTSPSGVLTAKSVVIGAPRGNFGHGFGGGWHGPGPGRGAAGSSPGVSAGSTV
jgi:hypothetical protein